MACKYLFSYPMPVDFIDLGDGVSIPTSGTKATYRLYRHETGFGWKTRCEKTLFEGPCWVWQDDYGAKPDTEFEQKAKLS